MIIDFYSTVLLSLVFLAFWHASYLQSTCQLTSQKPDGPDLSSVPLAFSEIEQSIELLKENLSLHESELM